MSFTKSIRRYFGKGLDGGPVSAIPEADPVIATPSRPTTRPSKRNPDRQSRAQVEHAGEAKPKPKPITPAVKKNDRNVKFEKSKLEIKKIYIHCSADLPWSQKTVEEIDRDHRARGWNEIGYHYVGLRKGGIELGRSVHKMGAHAYPDNKASIGYCMIGGLDKNARPAPEFTRAHWADLRYFLREMKKLYPDATIHGHNELGGKACPSFDVQVWLKTGEVVPVR